MDGGIQEFDHGTPNDQGRIAGYNISISLETQEHARNKQFL